MFQLYPSCTKSQSSILMYAQSPNSGGDQRSAGRPGNKIPFTLLSKCAGTSKCWTCVLGRFAYKSHRECSTFLVTSQCKPYTYAEPDLWKTMSLSSCWYAIEYILLVSFLVIIGQLLVALIYLLQHRKFDSFLPTFMRLENHNSGCSSCFTRQVLYIRPELRQCKVAFINPRAPLRNPVYVWLWGISKNCFTGFYRRQPATGINSIIHHFPYGKCLLLKTLRVG